MTTMTDSKGEDETRSSVRSAPAGFKFEAQARAHYHMRIKYISGGETSYFYEVNKSKELVEGTALQIQNLVPAIRFEGHRIYPKRINEYKIFVTESPSEMSPESVRDNHPDGYDFGGDDVTLEITTRGPTPKYHCVKCDAIVNPTDEKCPNGHDLSIVGRKIKLTLTEGLALSESVSLSSGLVVNKIENIVKALEPGPKTTEAQSDIEYVKDILEARDEQTRKALEELKTTLAELFETKHSLSENQNKVDSLSKNLDKEESLTLLMRYASGIFGLVLFLVGIYGLIWVFPTNVSLNITAAYVPCLIIGAFLLLLSIRPESITGAINLGTKGDS